MVISRTRLISPLMPPGTTRGKGNEMRPSEEFGAEHRGDLFGISKRDDVSAGEPLAPGRDNGRLPGVVAPYAYAQIVVLWDYLGSETSMMVKLPPPSATSRKSPMSR